MTRLRRLLARLRDHVVLARSRATLYGFDRTLHRTGHLDVQVDGTGRVVAVWFRCAQLPFAVSVVPDATDDDGRASRLLPPLRAVVLGGRS